MKKSHVITVEKFREAFTKVGWVEARSKDQQYIIWRSPKEKDLWIQLPASEDAIDYKYYAERNVLMLLYILDMPETDRAVDEIISQLRAYNYKLVNRIVGNAEFKSDAIPYELAIQLPQKNVEAFRHFYLTSKNTKNRSIPIEKFELNHTEVGSFVIPVSILVEDEDNTTLVPVKSETNHVLHKYLKMVDTLMKIPADNPVTYAEKVVGSSIDSKIVKDFLGRANSIAKAKEKYGSQVEAVTISSTGSPILDFNLEKKDKDFEVINIGQSIVLEEDYITEIEKLEIRSDENRVDERNAKIDVVVDNIDRNGNVKFTVMAINGSELTKSFKASSIQLSKDRLDQFAEYFKNDGAAIVRGDIEKSKNRMGRVIIDSVGPEGPDPNSRLEL